MDELDREVYAQTDRGSRIGTARDRLALVKAGMPLVEMYRRYALSKPFPFNESPVGIVPAKIEHGRWIVYCPMCTGAADADPEQPIHFCFDCGNADNGGHVMAVEFPKDRDEIERLLLSRSIENRNWNPDEAQTDIEIENVEHGIIDLRDGVSDAEATLAGQALRARRG